MQGKANQIIMQPSDPIEVLKLRFASGDISHDELLEKINIITELSKNQNIF